MFQFLYLAMQYFKMAGGKGYLVNAYSNVFFGMTLTLGCLGNPTGPT